MALSGAIGAAARQRVLAAGVNLPLRLPTVVVAIQIPTAKLKAVRAVNAVDVAILAVDTAPVLVATTGVVNATATALLGRLEGAFAVG